MKKKNKKRPNLLNIMIQIAVQWENKMDGVGRSGRPKIKSLRLRKKMIRYWTVDELMFLYSHNSNRKCNDGSIIFPPPSPKLLLNPNHI